MKLTATLYLIIALALSVLYGGFASYQWWTAKPECDNGALTQRIGELEAANAAMTSELRAAAIAQQGVVDDGNQAAATSTTIYRPLKETVREIHHDSCPGVFDDSVRDALEKAVSAANASGYNLPATGDNAGPENPD